MTSPKKEGGPPVRKTTPKKGVYWGAELTRPPLLFAQISHAVPQQFITKLVNGRLVTTPVQHATA